MFNMSEKPGKTGNTDKTGNTANPSENCLHYTYLKRYQGTKEMRYF